LTRSDPITITLDYNVTRTTTMSPPRLQCHTHDYNVTPTITMLHPRCHSLVPVSLTWKAGIHIVASWMTLW